MKISLPRIRNRGRPRNLGKYERALKSCDKAVELNPNDDDAWNDRGVALFYLGRYMEAVKNHDKAIELNPRNEFAWANRGNALGSLGKYEEALKSFDKAIELNPRDDIAWYNKGKAFYSLGKYEEALKSCDKAIELNPKNDSAWSNRGNALDRLGRYEEGLKSFDKAVELNPYDDDAWNNRGANLYEYFGRFKEAKESYLRALKLRPDDLGFALNLAETSIASGDIAKGLETAMKVLNHVEKDGRVNEQRYKVISLFLCVSAYFFKGENFKAEKKREELLDYLKELKDFRETSWDFHQFRRIIEEKLEGDNRLKLLSLIALIAGENF